jgi:hypothetical protein
MKVNLFSPKFAYAMMALGLTMATSIILALTTVTCFIFGFLPIQLPFLVTTIIFGVLINLFGLIISVKVEEKRNEKTKSN